MKTHAVILVGSYGEEFGFGEDDRSGERVARCEAGAPVGGPRSGSARRPAGARRDEHHVEAGLVSVHTIQNDLHASQSKTLNEKLKVH